jgi:hypothetical protein
MKLNRYTEFTNEGIISKGLEIINYKTVKENDKIADKYIKMIYDNYKKHNNIMAAKIMDNTSSCSLIYKISDDPYAQAGTAGGQYPKFIEVKLTSIKERGWKNDITRARIEVEQNGDGPSKRLVGRDMKTKKTVVSETGLGDVYQYINISQSQVDKIIKFFKSEYIKNYPEMSNYKAFNYMAVLEIDVEMRKRLEKKGTDRRKEYEANFNKLKDKFQNHIENNSSNSFEDIKDYFIDLSDYIKENMYEIKLSVSISSLIDGTAYLTSKSTYSDRTFFNYLLTLPSFFREDKIYYILEYKIEYNSEDIFRDGDGGFVNYEKIETFLEKEYSLKTDIPALGTENKKNSKFKLCAIGDPNFHEDLKGFKSGLVDKVVIILEQLD